MGLGLYTKASLVVAKPGLLARPRPLTIQDLQSACSKFLSGTPLDELKSFDGLWDGKPGFSLGLHPAEEGMDFHIEGNDVFVSAKTSNAGPGYHAFATSLLDHLKATLHLDWQFGSENDELQDEAGYWHDRDYTRLQDAFAKFMAQLFRMCLDKRVEGSSGFRLGMPLEFDVILPDKDRTAMGALTQLGPLSWIDLERGASARLNDRNDIATRYFPWWDRDFGADFHAKLALHDMWMHVPWTSPVSEEDRAAMHHVLDRLDMARKLDPARVLPDIAIAELRRLARSTDAPVLAAPGSIGYRRHLVSRPITGHWRVHVPGSLSEVEQDDKGRVIYALANFEVHGSSFRLSSMNDEPMPDDEAAGEALFAQAGLRGTIDFKVSDEGDGFSMTAVANTPVIEKARERGVVTVWFADETLKPLAEQVLRSIRYDPPRP